MPFQKKLYKKDESIFQGLDTFDVFDEVDALMTPKK